MTIEQLQARRDVILNSMSSGQAELASGTDRLAYQTVDQQRIALQALDAEIAKLEGSTGRTFVVTSCRGL